MPPRRRIVAPTLTDDDLAALTEALATGARRTVYLRDAVPSLGLAAGSSARVVAVADGVITVRPKGVGDDLPFEPSDLALSAAAARAPRATPRRSATRSAPPRGPRGATTVRVVLTGSGADGWSVEVTSGSRPPGKPVGVSAEAVAGAVAALGEPRAANAVHAVLEHARTQAQQRVAALSDELAAARASLDALSR
ncbi:MAG: DUF6319 family protein [Mycobacteriaceae bacterium]